MASPVRRLEVSLTICGLLVGLGATAAGTVAARHLQQAGVQRPGPVTVEPVGRGDPSPSALDAEWAAYSDRSTCTDWSGGDGVSAVRLSSTQLAWFFSDTFLGPAGPSIGFSHLSGFVHNAIVMQTANGPRSRFVTLTGGGACAGPGQPGAATSVVSPGSGQRRQRYWAGDGIRVGRYVVMFYNRFQPGGPPFVPVGSAIAEFPASQLAAAGRGPAYGGVARPTLTLVPAYSPPGGTTPIAWGAALLQQGQTVYIYGWCSPDVMAHTRQLYVARVAVSQLTDFAAWRFFAGGRWAAGQENSRPVQPPGMALNVATAFSVVPAGGRYWLIQQAVRAGSPDIDAYPGRRLGARSTRPPASWCTGPPTSGWTRPTTTGSCTRRGRSPPCPARGVS